MRFSCYFLSSSNHHATKMGWGSLMLWPFQLHFSRSLLPDCVRSKTEKSWTCILQTTSTSRNSYHLKSQLKYSLILKQFSKSPYFNTWTTISLQSLQIVNGWPSSFSLSDSRGDIQLTRLFLKWLYTIIMNFRWTFYSDCSFIRYFNFPTIFWIFEKQIYESTLFYKNLFRCINVDSTHGSQHLGLSYGITFDHATFYPHLIPEHPWSLCSCLICP